LAHLVLTELRPTGRLFAGKELLRDGTIKSAPAIKHRSHRQLEFDDLGGLYRYLLKAQHDNAILIRGVTSASNGLVLRRLRSEKEPNGFEDLGAAFLPLDIDGALLSIAHDWLLDPKGAVDSVIARLPEPLCDCSYIASCSTELLKVILDGRGLLPMNN
jgi:hypothetical protein